MDANQTSELLLNIIRKSNLNFNIQESPFSITVTLRKSFIKEKNGSFRCSGLETLKPSMQKETNLLTKNQDPATMAKHGFPPNFANIPSEIKQKNFVRNNNFHSLPLPKKKSFSIFFMTQHPLPLPVKSDQNEYLCLSCRRPSSPPTRSKTSTPPPCSPS